MGFDRPLSAPFLFRTFGKGTDMATPLGLEKYGRIDFSPGRWTSMGENAYKLVLTHDVIFKSTLNFSVSIKRDKSHLIFTTYALDFDKFN